MISIHALRGEGDPKVRAESSARLKFQSTPSVGRATLCCDKPEPWNSISIHALRGEGDPCGSVKRDFGRISIHALRGEGDLKQWALKMKKSIFQSTPSVGRATNLSRVWEQSR